MRYWCCRRDVSANFLIGKFIAVLKIHFYNKTKKILVGGLLETLFWPKNSEKLSAENEVLVDPSLKEETTFMFEDAVRDRLEFHDGQIIPEEPQVSSLQALQQKNGND